MNSKIAIRSATLDDRDFIVGLLPRLVEFGLHPWRDPSEITGAIAREIDAILASTSQDSAIFIAENIEFHDRYSPGFHHLAFNADSRERVDSLYKLVQEIGATVLDPPAEYQYLPGYYAVFFADPDGLKLELVHMPNLPE